ncbi:MAG: hypothetical protein H6772_02215 [Pseudomonadales bacterium]|nr:hypothetical protein [Pseudomonadales bacterium]
MTKSKQQKTIDDLIKMFDPIESEVIRMMGNQSIFKEIITISQKNPKTSRGNSFWDFFKESYVSLMVSAVCRQIDSDTRSSSLINLLNKLIQADVTMLLTKKWYSSRYHRDNDIMPGFMEGIGEDDFENNFGSKEFVDPDVIRKDITKLIRNTKEIKKYRNKRIAHRDSNDNLVFDVNFNDLDKAIETVRAITSKYYLLLKQGGNDLIPIDQTDWQNMFTIPWIKKGQ